MHALTLRCGRRLLLPPAQRLAGTNCGTSGVWHYDSGVCGPHVAITALMHGNEVCGAVALAGFVDAPPALPCGRLTIAFLNLEAYARVTDDTRNEFRWIGEDMNRVWGRVHLAAAASDSYELSRARQVLACIADADVLLDLHSMHAPGAALGLTGAPAKNLAMARRLGVPQFIVRDAGHAAGLRLLDWGRFGDPACDAVAMLVECGYHFDALTTQTARTIVAAVLREYLDADHDAPAAAPPQTIVAVSEAVTIRHDGFSFTREFENMALIGDEGTIVGYDGPVPLVTPHRDALLVMPAPPRYRRPGMTAVRFGRFTDDSTTNLRRPE